LISNPLFPGANSGSDRNLLPPLRVLFRELRLDFRLPEMIDGPTRWSLIGVVWAALIFAPAVCSAQSMGETGSKGGSNLTRQTQNEIDIALPSLAPLVERVMPAAVNISVELKEQAATEGEGDTGNESASPLGPGGTPFDQFLKRFFEQPFQFRNPAERSWRWAPGSSSTPPASNQQPCRRQRRQGDGTLSG
jgi:S1-C subfamily serine protease